MSLYTHKTAQLLVEKCNQYGIAALSDEELLTLLFINSSEPAHIARQIIRSQLNFRTLLLQDPTAFNYKTQLDLTYHYVLQATQEISRRTDKTDLDRLALANTGEVIRFLKRQLRDEPNEVFGALFFDTQYRVIDFELLFKGTVNRTTVYIRTILQRLITLNCSAVIFAHNHPSGHCKPSKDDELLTKKLDKILSAIEVQLIDHFIIADNSIFSIQNQKTYLNDDYSS